MPLSDGVASGASMLGTGYCDDCVTPRFPPLAFMIAHCLPQGSWQRDLCTAWWCGPCALAQETREIAIRSAAAANAMAAAAAGGKGTSVQELAPGEALAPASSW